MQFTLQADRQIRRYRRLSMLFAVTTVFSLYFSWQRNVDASLTPMPCATMKPCAAASGEPLRVRAVEPKFHALDVDECTVEAMDQLRSAYHRARVAAMDGGTLGHADSESIMPLLWRFYYAPTPGRVQTPVPLLGKAETGRHIGVDSDSGRRGWLPNQAQRAPAPQSQALVIDIGANVGEVTSAMLHLYTALDCLKMKASVAISANQPPCEGVRPSQARVLSFEASPATCEILRQRATNEKWALAGWELECSAMADREGGGKPGSSLSFFTSLKDGDRQASLGESQATHAGGTHVQVPAYSLDRWLVEKGLSNERIHLLKVDAEGFDAGVLDGANEALTEGRVQFLTFEYNDKWQDSSAPTSGDDPMPRPYRLKSFTKNGVTVSRM